MIKLFQIVKFGWNYNRRWTVIIQWPVRIFDMKPLNEPQKKASNKLKFYWFPKEL